jgi:hypothetical protein
VSVIDDEDRVWHARVAAAPDGWPFDADRDDPLTAQRIAVTSSHPRWCYLVGFDRESEERPTDHEAAMLASYLDEYRTHWYRPGYRQHMERRPLDVDGGANGVVFHKWAADDWGYRRRSWTMGPIFWPGPAWYRERYGHEYPPGGGRAYSLAALMDKIHTIVDEPIKHWVEWKAAHPEVFGTVVVSGSEG